MTETGHTSPVMEDRFIHSAPTRDGDSAIFTGLTRFIAGIGVMSIFAASTPTSGVVTGLPGPADSWRETSVVLASAATARERRVSLAEARSMALRVLREAEERRARQAEEDARVPFFWETE
jgi:hypothetical protein